MTNCYRCGTPSDTFRNCQLDSCNLLHIQCSECCKTSEETCSNKCLSVKRDPFLKEIARYKGSPPKASKGHLMVCGQQGEPVLAPGMNPIVQREDCRILYSDLFLKNRQG